MSTTVSAPKKTIWLFESLRTASEPPSFQNRSGWFGKVSVYTTLGSALFTRRMPPADCMRATFAIVRPMHAVDGADRSTRNGCVIGWLASRAPGKYLATICSPVRRGPTAPSAHPCAPHCERPMPWPQPLP